MSQEALIIFQKNPIKGLVKTRLASTVGDELALSIYTFLLRKTFEEVEQIPQEKMVFFSDFIPGNNPNPNHSLYLQEGVDLGEKMKNAFQKIFSMGFQKAVIIGTDCPELTHEFLNQAFNLLNQSDLVIGPAADGGYYLLGMKSAHSCLFQGIKWSTSQVFSRTLEQANHHNLTFSLLPKLHDIDEEEDWMRFITQNPIYGKLPGYHH
ncbi:TIGR04282 family arsenosugar biosynthesis glycosyltransferase [Algoriphagus aquatilis]|uniref:TIGR04282 family arsenosugar biosynthesis glycosyltransferase n=1 Tax=Algoriphagus aquatilis TaxID=490186 RepID=A0ABW0BSM7_9BACT